MDKKILAAVRKKARGYKVTEKVEEKQIVDGEMQVVKVRLSEKDVPPDISAAKYLADITEDKPIDSMTKEELLAEKRRLLRQLWENQDEIDKDKI